MNFGGKYTPGPWRCVIGGVRGEYRVIMDRQPEIEASNEDGIDGGSVTHANKALIEAAPEMYEALKVMVEYFGFENDRPDDNAILAHGRSALKKVLNG